MMERLQKLLSGSGLCSRREAEKWIQAGRVTVNGAPACLGMSADIDRDSVFVDGKPLKQAEKLVYIMLNKPVGYVTTLKDEKGRRTVAELVQSCGLRVYPVGRLDLNSEGLLVLTNDGDAAYRLTHPSHQVDKRYEVRVSGEKIGPAAQAIREMRELDGEAIRQADVEVLWKKDGQAQLSVVIHEGKNRQLRRMCAAAGLRVHQLRRVEEGGLHLGGLPTGQWRYLTEEEIELVKNA